MRRGPWNGSSLMRSIFSALLGAAITLVLSALPARGQEPQPAEPHHHEQEMGHEMPKPHEQHEMHDMQGMEGMHGMHDMHMSALFGPYSMTRESSGTAWQPESAPHHGFHFT